MCRRAASVRAAMPPPAQWTEIASRPRARRVLDRRADVGRRRDVASHVLGPTAELGGDRRAPLVVHVGDDDFGAGCVEPTRGGLARGPTRLR